MSNITNKVIRVYRTQRSNEEIPMGVSVEYAHPKYFNQPKTTVDFVITDRFDIELAYEKIGTPAIDYFHEALQENIPAETDEDIVEDVVIDEIEQEDVSVEEIEAVQAEEELDESDVDDNSPDPLSMKFFELKAYTKEVTGQTPKNKAEAFELLGLSAE